MPVSISRKTAYRHLLRIIRDGAFSSELLGSNVDEVPDLDRNLIHKLTLGVLRRQLLIDSVINDFSSIETGKLDIEVLVSLRLGAYQLLFLDKIPAYSAISESVELTKYARKRSASGFVNAILRRISENKKGIIEGFDRLAEHIVTSHPEWLLEIWRSEFGPPKAVSIALANNQEPPAAFRFTSAFDNLEGEEKSAVQEAVEGLRGFRGSQISASGFVVDRRGETIREYANRGLVYFQDEASQLAAEIVAEVAVRRVLDMCAAPGSKATQIARKRDLELLVASEYYPHRAKTLALNSLLQDSRIAVICSDGLSGTPFEDRSFDTVLVDAPCSGTGTLRRNPELRYRLRPDDIFDLKAKQLRLLLAASKLVQSGGFLVYSTCSIERDENEGVVYEYLSAASDFAVYKPRIAGHLMDSTGFVRTFPDTQDTDGFFVACLRRK